MLAFGLHKVRYEAFHDVVANLDFMHQHIFRCSAYFAFPE